MKKKAAPKLPADWKERLKAIGFTVSDEAGVSAVTRDGCTATIEIQGGESHFRTTPGLVFGIAVARLLDRGFQKFWQVNEQTLIPARAVELKALGDFDRDLRSVLGMTQLYHEAIGIVSSVYHYDRVEGREPGKRHETF